MARKEKNPLQIIRKDGKNCFVEALSNSFEINKILFKFVTYDSTQDVGSKFTNEIDIYMDFSQYMRISKGITSGEYMYEMNQRKNNGEKYVSMTLAQGGTTAADLIKKGKARDDGNGISRILTIAPSNIGYFLTAVSGPGGIDKEGKGLIVPLYKMNAPEQKVSIPISKNDINELFLAVDAQILAYLTSKAIQDNNRIIKLEAEVEMLKGVIMMMANIMGVDKYQLEKLQKEYDEKINPIPYYQKNNNKKTSTPQKQNNYSQRNNYQQPVTQNNYQRQQTPQNLHNPSAQIPAGEEKTFTFHTVGPFNGNSVPVKIDGFNQQGLLMFESNAASTIPWFNKFVQAANQSSKNLVCIAKRINGQFTFLGLPKPVAQQPSQSIPRGMGQTNIEMSSTTQVPPFSQINEQLF